MLEYSQTRTTINKLTKGVQHMRLIPREELKSNLQELRYPKFRRSRHILDQVWESSKKRRRKKYSLRKIRNVGIK